MYNNPLRFVDPSGFCGDDNGQAAPSDSNGDGVPDDRGRQDGASSAAGAAACMQELTVTALQCGPKCMQTLGQLIAQWNSYVDSLDLDSPSGLPTAQGNSERIAVNQQGTSCDQLALEIGGDAAGAFEKGYESASLVAENSSSKPYNSHQAGSLRETANSMTKTARVFGAVDLGLTYAAMRYAYSRNDMTGAITHGTDLVIDGVTMLVPGWGA